MKWIITHPVHPFQVGFRHNIPDDDDDDEMTIPKSLQNYYTSSKLFQWVYRIYYPKTFDEVIPYRCNSKLFPQLFTTHSFLA